MGNKSSFEDSKEAEIGEENPRCNLFCTNFFTKIVFFLEKSGFFDDFYEEKKKLEERIQK